MRSFVVFSALFAVGLCGVLPSGYNYNSGDSFNHAGLVGPIFDNGGSTGSIGSVGSVGSVGDGISGGFGGISSGPVSGGFGGISSGPISGGFGGISSGPISGGFGGISSGPVSGGFGGISSGPVTAPQFGSNGFVPSSGHVVEEAPRHEAPIVTKQFYLHSAPEDTDSIGKTKHFVLGRAQKNYRVVFIKSPSSSNANVKLSAEYAPQEEKTVIYVLSQKDHELDVNDIATPAPTQPSKPEVFFIKYKTPEEAAHAQNEIQKQYDILGGHSQVSNEGHAPVTDVSGSLNPAGQTNTKQTGVGYLPPNASQNYLPPSH